MFRVSAAALSLLVLVGGPVMAANARNPYGNIDRRVDAGNNTGDSQVEQLNSAQLNQNYYRNNGGAPAFGTVPVSPAPVYPMAVPPR